MAKIAVYNEKGRVGKTPISLELVLRLGSNYATNQNRPRKDIQAIVPDDEFLQVLPHQKFPKLDADFPVVFDLAGELVGYENSIVSALEQADLIIVPVVNEPDAIIATAYAITELRSLDSITAKFLVIANMLRKPEELEEIRSKILPLLGEDIPILPLRYSRAFDRVMGQGTSVEAMIAKGGLPAWNFKNVGKEFNEIMSYIEK